MSARERELEQEVRNLAREVERLRAALAESRGVAPPPPGQRRLGPDPAEAFPFPGNRTFGFLRALVTRPNIEVGEFTYYSDPDGAERFEERCVLFQTADPDDRLEIGRFTSIAPGVRFLMQGAVHADAGSTYPFAAFGRGWHESAPARRRGPTIVGSDVWLGLECCVLPGVRIGDGAIVGARAMVTKDVPPYAVVAGNPARIIRMRHDEATVERLRAIRWWDWPPERIARNLPEIVGGDWARLT
ncbi:MAG: CatB-related O-acetyltransferase [Planctomycetota bacterium]